MKYADVSHCFKKGDNLFKENYGPFIVLTVISKLYEAILNNQMVNHFRDLFNILLSAIRKHYNCQSLLLKLIEVIKSAQDKGHKTGAVFHEFIQGFWLLTPCFINCKIESIMLLYSRVMMTSSNGNIFRVTGHLCGEFTGPRWIPHTKARELWCLLWSAPE